TPARNRSSAPATLNVLYPPRNLQMKAFTEGGKGTAVILLCTVESNPLSHVTLLKEGQLVASSPSTEGDQLRQSIHISSSPNELRLELQEATEEDEGEYECWARSQLGSTHTSLPLRVQAIRVVVTPSTEVPEGTDVILTCQDAGAHPGTLYTWYKNGRWLAEGFDASFPLPGAWRTDAGAYGCQARRGLRRRWAPPVTLRVLYAPQKPSFISLVDSQGGHHAILVCTADSFPPSAITLHRGHGHAPLVSTQGASDPRFIVHLTPNSLRVEMVELELQDTGLYICSVNNSYGTASSTLHLDVGGVKIVVEPSPEVAEGTKATMTCLGIPWVGEEANYTWYKNSRWLQDGPVASLALAHVSSTDTGSYHCRASGTRGSATSAPLSLSVLCECPQVLQGQATGSMGCRVPNMLASVCSSCLLPTDPPRDVSISTFLENRSGRVGILLCTADSHPPSTMLLYHHGQLLASSLAPATSPGFRVSPSHNSLRVELQDVGAEDSGEYICVASSALGNATASAYFSVHTLTYLQALTVAAALLLALICVATLTVLALKLWPR
ncbi:SN protein, partial [Eubucco bourcierii]|nr:SN protein [Eubucco bourcierii]